MTRNRMLVILNPTAGKGRAGERRGELDSLLSARGLDYELRLTEAPGHALELARAAGAEGFDLVVAVGGDGTVNEVLNGLAGAGSAGGRAVAFGAIPAGRGNDFACGADIPSSWPEAVRLLAEGGRSRLDLGRVTGGRFPEGRWFGNGVGIGFDTIVGLHAARMRFARGAAAYLLGALRTFAQFPPAPEIELVFDGQVLSGPSNQVSVMNGRRMGGMFFMAPEARVDDGLFDLCVAGKLSRLDMAALLVRYMKGSQASHPKIRTARAARVEVRAPGRGLVVHADGETVCEGGDHLLLECVPGALELVGRGSSPR